MFPTQTKQTPRIVGPEYLRQYVQWHKLPHLAIGGINPDNVSQLIEAGVKGIAVSSAVCSALDPGDVTRRLVEAMKGPFREIAPGGSRGLAPPHHRSS